MIACMSGPAKTDLYPTPQTFFNRMSKKYGPFEVDVCALPDNAKCVRFFTPEQDGLKQPWVGRCWCNPPYGRTIGQWVRKAWQSSLGGSTVVLLVPARVDVRWWNDYVKPYAAEVEFVKGRLRFGNSDHPAPFPSAVVVFRPDRYRQCNRCDRWYVPARNDAKYCSAGCKQAAYRERCVTDRNVTTPDESQTTADRLKQTT